MLDREKVFELINAEREFQDKNYDPNFMLTSGQTREQRDLEVAPGVLMLKEYSDKAGQAWVSTKGSNLTTLQQVAKIAAIAVRVLERAGGSEELLKVGLR